MLNGKTIVSVTPLRVDRDTRTLKIANAFALAGARSIIVENRTSHGFSPPLGVELITLAEPPGALNQDTATKARSGLVRRLPEWLSERLHYLGFVFLYFIFRPFISIRKLPKADLYYLHEYRLFPMLKRALRKGGYLVYDAHDFYAESEDSSSYSAFWKRRFFPLLMSMEKACVKYAVELVTVSDGVANLIKKRFAVAPVIVRNLHDPSLENSRMGSIRKLLELKNDDFLVVIVGNHKPGQAGNEFLEALAQLPTSVHAAFIGMGYDTDNPFIEKLGLSEQVHIIDYVRSDEIVPLIRDADAAAILYFPLTLNYLHSLPNKFYQCVAAGLPILYPELPEIKRLIGDRKIGTSVNALSADTIKKALIQISSKSVFRINCRKNVEELSRELDWAADRTRLIRMIESSFSCNS